MQLKPEELLFMEPITAERYQNDVAVWTDNKQDMLNEIKSVYIAFRTNYKSAFCLQDLFLSWPPSQSF